MPGDRREFPIVGLGASAGGLAALEELFAVMPADSGMAFVVVTHQQHQLTTVLPELLGHHTAMQVIEVSSQTRLEPDHIYTAPPGHFLDLDGGVLQPVKIETSAAMPIDYFFRALARDAGRMAIGVILSGTGSDGSLGVKELKASLGMVMAQSAESAEYSGMPQSALATRLVDYVLPVSEMPEALLGYAARIAGLPSRPPLGTLSQVFAIVARHTGHDLSQYKQSTIKRRIARRMSVHQLDSLSEYVELLERSAEEVRLLFSEMLIGVTSFFRDPEAWAVLEASLHELIGGLADGSELRAWIPGCATGEEAYSLAMLIRECMGDLSRSLTVQIFATDIDSSAIEAARAGSYPAGIAGDVPRERLARSFYKQDGAYQVRNELREMVVFAPHNLIADPPFTRLDILSCRNLLIYLDPVLQRSLLPTFHYALKPGGLLLLGSAESLGGFDELFAPLDKQQKVFRRKEVAAGAYAIEFPRRRVTRGAAGQVAGAAGRESGPSIEQLIQARLLDELVPPTILVRERGEVVHVHGRTGQFLEPAPGPHATASVFKMARPGLALPLAAGMRQAAAEGAEVINRGIAVKTNGGSVTVDLRVCRLESPDELKGLFRISFEDSSLSSSQGGNAEPSPVRIAELELELAYWRESYQSTIEELQATNAELKSTNEELQSTNEELETSKEELQSLNEELQTVNVELQRKVEELSRSNSDMSNLLDGTNIATLFLDANLRIKRYTEPTREVIHLIDSDIGRPIGDLVSRLRYDRLAADARRVLRTLRRYEVEVSDAGDRWFLIRIIPYRTDENVVDGLVITFIDVTRMKRLLAERARLIEALESSRVTLVGQDRDLRITWASNDAFGRPVNELIGRSDLELFAEDGLGLAELKRRVIETGVPAHHRLEVTVDETRRTYDVYLEPRRDSSGAIEGLSCVIVDVT